MLGQVRGAGCDHANPSGVVPVKGERDRAGGGGIPGKGAAGQQEASCVAKAQAASWDVTCDREAHGSPGCAVPVSPADLRWGCALRHESLGRDWLKDTPGF